MRKSSIVIGAMALAMVVGGCAFVRAAREDEPPPSASISSQMLSLAGHWQGVVWETGAHLVQGVTPLDLQIGSDGTWRGRVGKSDASGRAWIDDRGWLVLSGNARGSGIPGQNVFYELKGDSVRRWGEIEGIFSGRPAHASVSLRKTS